MKRPPVLIVCLSVSASSAAAAGQWDPTMLDAPLPARLSAHLDVPDWLSFARNEYDLIERQVPQQHPLVHALACNTAGRASGELATLPCAWDMPLRPAAVRAIETIPSPVEIRSGLVLRPVLAEPDGLTGLSGLNIRVEVSSR